MEVFIPYSTTFVQGKRYCIVLVPEFKEKLCFIKYGSFSGIG
jgi:hypothetical protein